MTDTIEDDESFQWRDLGNGRVFDKEGRLAACGGKEFERSARKTETDTC